MIVCKNCGEKQPDETVFCGRCGAFLEWEGEQLGEQSGEGAEQPATAPEADTATVGAAAIEAVPTRQPSAARQRPTAPAPAKPGDLPSGSSICGSCGTGNDPQRNFCRNCGTSLADAAIVARPPWWRRIFRHEKTYAAGTRRRHRRRFRTAVTLATAIAVLAVAVIAVGPLRPTLVRTYHDLRNDVSGPHAVHPSRVWANSTTPHHRAALAFDGAKNTYWGAPPGAARGDNPILRASFRGPIHLADIGITPGVSTSTPKFLAGPRPRVIVLTAHVGRQIKNHRINLLDNAGFQKFHWDIAGVKELDLRVVGSNKSTVRTDTAIAEVELFARD